MITTETSFEETTRIYQILWRTSALLPLPGHDFDLLCTRLLSVFTVVCTVTVMAMFFGYNIETIMTARSWKAEEIYLTLLVFSIYPRYHLLLWRRQGFVRLFEICRELWQFCNAQGRAIVASYELKIRIFYGVGLCNTFFTVCLLPIKAYFTRLPALDGTNATDRRVLPFVWFTENEPEKYLGYEATLGLQVLVTFTGSVCAAACDASIAAFIMLAAGYFHQLRERLTEACDYDDDDPETKLDIIMSCLKYHQRLLSYCTNLKDLSQTLLFMQLFGSSWSLSLVLIKLAGSDADKYEHLPMLILCICIAFMVQWTADQVASQSERMENSVYEVLTRNINDKALCRDLCIMFIRSQDPVQFRAAGFLDLSLQNFTTMMKGAYSFFTVLRKIDI